MYVCTRTLCPVDKVNDSMSIPFSPLKIIVSIWSDTMWHNYSLTCSQRSHYTRFRYRGTSKIGARRYSCVGSDFRLRRPPSKLGPLHPNWCPIRVVLFLFWYSFLLPRPWSFTLVRYGFGTVSSDRDRTWPSWVPSGLVGLRSLTSHTMFLFWLPSPGPRPSAHLRYLS